MQLSIKCFTALWREWRPSSMMQDSVPVLTEELGRLIRDVICTSKVSKYIHIHVFSTMNKAYLFGIANTDYSAQILVFYML